MLQVLFDDFQRPEKSISIVLICVFKKSGFKILLKFSAFFDNGKCLFRTLKFNFSSVSFYTVSGQISFFYQFIYKMCIRDRSDFNLICGSVVIVMFFFQPFISTLLWKMVL